MLGINSIVGNGKMEKDFFFRKTSKTEVEANQIKTPKDDKKNNTKEN